MNANSLKGRLLIVVFAGIIVVGGSLLVAHTIHANSLTSQVTVGVATPVVSAVSVNSGAAIVLTANTTTNINVVATITDGNGCSEITGGTTTILLYRSGYTSSTCLTSANNLDCYQAFAFTASSSCAGGTQNTTTTFPIQYFAHATDASSSFSGQSWFATVFYRTPDGATGSNESAGGVTLNTLTAINVTTSSINYGTITANSNTGVSNQVTTTTNAGNSSTSLQLSAQSTLTSGGNVITTSSQAFATSSFNYNNAGSSTGLTGSAVTVTGYTLTSPTTTTNVSSPVFWGLGVPNGTPTGTYSGTNLFQALFHA